MKYSGTYDPNVLYCRPFVRLSDVDIFFYKRDIVILYRNLKNGTGNKASSSVIHSFKSSLSRLERLFDQTLELQNDMQHIHPGLTLDYFKVFVNIAAEELGWSTVSP